MGAVTDPKPAPDRIDDLASLRERIDALLADGLETAWQQRADSSAEVNIALAQLQRAPRDDLPLRLALAGFSREPYQSDDDLAQACANCMYFVSYRQFCELPELMLPVRPQWSCRLWRI